jgi:hypothetical protein
MRRQTPPRARTLGSPASTLRPPLYYAPGSRSEAVLKADRKRRLVPGHVVFGHDTWHVIHLWISFGGYLEPGWMKSTNI